MATDILIPRKPTKTNKSERHPLFFCRNIEHFQMRYIAAYLLLQCGGNQSPSAADVKKLLGTVGIETDGERLEKLISELKGKSTADVRLL